MSDVSRLRNNNIEEYVPESEDNRKFFYRYEDRLYYDYKIQIQELKFILVKETPCGYWIRRYWGIDFGDDSSDSGCKKWIKKNPKNRNAYAFENKIDAIRNFAYRKNAQVRILESRLENAKMARCLAEKKWEELKGEKIHIHHRTGGREYFTPLDFILD